MNGPLFWPVYLAPSLLAWYRSRRGLPVQGPLLLLVLMNLFLGWTVIVWFLALANAFGLNPVAWVVLRLAPMLPTGGGAPATPMREGAHPTSATPCYSCHGSRKMKCSACQGHGSWYDPPQGEHGVAQLRTCHACGMSGEVVCASCGGSGLAEALL